MNLTVLICTHNRSDLLRRTLSFLNKAERVDSCPVEILVAANACSDGTMTLLHSYQEQASKNGWLPLRILEEPRPGKSFALNSAIPLLNSQLVAFVDDDHRVDSHYLVNIYIAAKKHPTTTLFCGRILPDWDGREPNWVHDDGPYRVFPLPVPRYDQGQQARRIDRDGPLPGGGNLILRPEVFQRIGNFSTELGPKGHDLGGGEDSDFVLRAVSRGEELQYVPDIVQYHYVDLERLRLGYLLRKSYQRTFSVTRVRNRDTSKVPAYLWRKLFTYCFQCIFCFGREKRRFYLIRTAAALGEIRGFSSPPHGNEEQPK